jgi:hypothetical protein
MPAKPQPFVHLMSAYLCHLHAHEHSLNNFAFRLVVLAAAPTSAILFFPQVPLLNQ